MTPLAPREPVEPVASPAAGGGSAADRTLARWVMGLRPRPARGVVLAVTLVAAATGLRLLLDDHLPPGLPFITYLPAVVLTALLGGMGPGLLASALSLASAGYLFVSPRQGVALDTPAVLAMLFFAAVCAVVVLAQHLMGRALARAARAEEQAQLLLAQRTVQFQELQHRVANNMAGAAMRMALLRRRLAHVPEAADIIAAEQRSFDALSRIHRALNDPADVARPWLDTLRRLAADFLHSQGGGHLTIEISGDPVVLDVDRSATLTLLVLEALTNALKHAYDPGESGRLAVELRREADGGLRLQVRDDGHGLRAPSDDAAHTPAGPALGHRIMHGLAASLQGALCIAHPPDGGTCLTLHFPERPGCPGDAAGEPPRAAA